MAFAVGGGGGGGGGGVDRGAGSGAACSKFVRILLASATRSSNKGRAAVGAAGCLSTSAREVMVSLMLLLAEPSAVSLPPSTVLVPLVVETAVVVAPAAV